MFLIVQPFKIGPDRCRSATVISEHETAAEAFEQLERLALRLDAFRIPGDPSSWSSSTISVSLFTVGTEGRGA